MLTVQEQLFDFIDNNEFEKAKGIIQSHPELINAVDKKSSSHLIFDVILSNDVDFIKYIVSHKDINFSFQDTSGRIVFDDVLCFNNPDVIKSTLKNPQSLIYAGKFSVNSVQDIIDKQKIAQDKCRANGEERKLGKITHQIENYEKIKVILIDAAIEQAKKEKNPKSANSPLRCALIRFCIRMDDVVLFRRLETEGLEPASLIIDAGESKRPRALFKKDGNVNLTRLLNEDVSASISALKSSPDSLFNKVQKQQELLKKVEDLEIELNQSKTKRNADHVKSEISAADQLSKNPKPGRP